MNGRAPHNSAHRIGARRQRGLATILTILLIGLALTATTLGVMSVVRGSQDKTLSVHSTTLAQSRAWAGVELLRLYLGSQIGSILTLALNAVIPITGIDGVEVKLISSSGSLTGTIRIIADVTGTGGGSSVTLRTVYDVSLLAGLTPTGTTTAPYSDLNVINIYNDLTMTGSVLVTGRSNARFVVDGNVNLSNASITGVDTLVATGNVSIDSAIAVNTVTSNGNLTLTGSANLVNATAMGNVSLDGSARATNIRSNGAVSFGGSSWSTAVDAIGSVNVTGGGAYATTINTMGGVNWTSSASGKLINANGAVTYAGGNSTTTINSLLGNVTLTGAGVSNVNTKGSVTLSYGSISTRLQAQGLLTVTGSGSVAAGTVGLGVVKPLWNNSVNVTTQLLYTVNVATVSVTPVTLNEVGDRRVDAYELKAYSNYVFEIDATGRKQVTVKGVNGISDGVYYLGNYSSGPYKDYLCTAVAADKTTCTAPATPGKTICKGYSEYNSCFSYNSSSTEWTIEGISAAPGLMWFKGNLNASTGVFHNSFIATGNIRTTGSNKTVAVNYAGYTTVCANAPTDTPPYARFDGLYPTSFCNIPSQSYTSMALGNIAFLSGGYVLGIFSGGDITLGASNDVYGTIVAGNKLFTGGSTRIHGYITVAAQAPASLLSPSTWGGSTYIDLTNLPTTFVPGALPCMGDCSTTSSGGTGAAVAVWTRYQ